MNHDILARLYYSSVYPLVASSGILLIQSQVVSFNQFGSSCRSSKNQAQLSTHLWRTCLQRIFQVFLQLIGITLYMLVEIVRSSFTGRGDPSELCSCTSLPTKTNSLTTSTRRQITLNRIRIIINFQVARFFAHNFREFATLN